MSLQPTDEYGIPSDTFQVARAVFPQGNIYMWIRDEFGLLFSDSQFTPLFARRGQPAESPWRLALVTVMQFLENLTDRQAADAVRSRIDWKYTLGLCLTDRGFDFSVLSEFRTRLVEGQVEHLLFEAVLKQLRTRGLLQLQEQRTDSTYVLGKIRKLNQLELAGETVRHTLDVLAEVAPEWLLSWLPSDWKDRYGHPWSDYRLPRKEDERLLLTQMVGQDGYRLLEQIIGVSSPSWLRELPAIKLLWRVWVQEFYIENEQVMCRTAQNSPPTGQEICSPHEPEARYGRKRDARWIGYKVHLTETCASDTPNLITHVETTLGSVSDVAMLSTIHKNLAESSREPGNHLVDAGYVTSDTLVESWNRHGVKIVGPVRINPSPQAVSHSMYDIIHFQIDWDMKQVTCPQGHKSLRWREGNGRRGKPNILVEFNPKDCQSCGAHSQCILSAKVSQRNLTFQQRDAFEALHEARQRQQTAAFRTQYAKRSGIEGTMSQAVFVLGMRRSRYRGLQKVHLQHLLTATAINLSRTFHWRMETPRSVTRKSSFARLVA